MSTANGERTLYRDFLALLSRQDKPGHEDPSFDFREWLLERRQLPHRIGFRRQNLETAFSANLPRLFPNLIAVDELDIDTDAPALVYGAILKDLSKSHASTRHLIPHVDPDAQVIFFEMGFLASTTSWAQALEARDPRMACLGYVYDDRAQYFMSDYATRLDDKLNGDYALSVEERERAQRVIDRIVSAKISKYNSQPFYRPVVSHEYSRRVLVVDQNYSDASTFYGRASTRDFMRMLGAAIAENPDAEILVKTHPDLNWTNSDTRRGYFDRLTSHGRIRLLRDSVNPFQLFELVDTVYVGTSGMGLEALLAGKRVVCFGAPFYAGWGLTDDRKDVPHRVRERDLLEVFHAFYIWYTIYTLPGVDGPAEIEDVLDFIEAKRPVRPIPNVVPAAPAVSIIIAMHNVERFIAECLTSIQKQSFQDFEVIVVDDVSPDRSAAIVADYAAGDPRIHLIQRSENVGPGFARNHGMSLAKGRYILFIDPDDYMPASDHLERVVSMAESDGADLVRYRKLFERVEDEQGNLVRMRPDATESFFENEVRGRALTDVPEIVHSRHFWNWLYRREFLEKNAVEFRTTYREERAFLLQVYLRNPRISTCTSEGVVYRIRPDSAVRRTQSMSDVLDQLDNFGFVIDLLRDNDAFVETSPYWKLARFQVSQFMHYLFFGFAYKTAVAENARDEFIGRLAETLDRAQLSALDLIDDPIQLSREHVEASAYGLMLAATRVHRPDFVDVALDLRPVQSSVLYEEFLREPQNESEREFQAALNLYARNERVATTTVAGDIPKKPRIIVHIGATKTGSTYIQQLLESNRPELLRQGVWYPEKWLFWQPHRSHKQAGHGNLERVIRTSGASVHEHVEATLKLLRGKVHTVIFSSEAFFLSSRSQDIADYFAQYEVEMLVYLRRQDDWANSQYAEFVAGGAVNRVSSPIEQWLEDPKTQQRMDYYAVLERWAAVIGRERVHARIYRRESFPNGDVVEDFVRQIGLPELGSLPRPAKEYANDFPFNGTQIRLIRHFNTLRWPNQEKYFHFIDDLTRKVSEFNAARGGAKPRLNLLSAELRRAVLERYAESNSCLAEHYLNRENGVAFEKPASHPPSEGASLSAEEVEIILQCYEDHSSGRKKTLASGHVTDADIKSTAVYRAYAAVGMLLPNNRKLQKLRRTPRRFFMDMKGLKGDLLRRHLGLARSS